MKTPNVIYLNTCKTCDGETAVTGWSTVRISNSDVEYISQADVLTEIARLQDSTMDEDGNFPTKSAMAQYNILCELESIINNLESKNYLSEYL